MKKSAVVMLLGLAACGGGDAPEANQDAVRDSIIRADSLRLNSSEVATTYAPELNVDLAAMTKTPSGLYVQDVQVGTGDSIAVGKTIAVHYTGWTSDGVQFDTSRDDGVPLEFQFGAMPLIDGWSEGMPGLKVGGKRRLVIPPSIGYGGSGSGQIPPGATLVFDVELVSIK